MAIGHVLLCLCSPLAPLVPRQGLRHTKEIHQYDQSKSPCVSEGISKVSTFKLRNYKTVIKLHPTGQWSLLQGFTFEVPIN